MSTTTIRNAGGDFATEDANMWMKNATEDEVQALALRIKEVLNHVQVNETLHNIDFYDQSKDGEYSVIRVRYVKGMAYHVSEMWKTMLPKKIGEI